MLRTVGQSSALDGTPIQFMNERGSQAPQDQMSGFDQRSYIDMNVTNYYSNIELTQKKQRVPSQYNLQGLLNNNGAGVNGYGGTAAGGNLCSACNTNLVAGAFHGTNSTARKSKGVPLSPLTRHITEQKRRGLEVIMSANRDGDQHHHHIQEPKAFVDWDELALRSVGCQTKES